MTRALNRGLALWAALLSFLPPARATWTELALPDLSGAFAPFAMAHLPDGRFVYAESGQFIRQDAFGAAAATSFVGEPPVDPSFLAVRSLTNAVAGGGGFGESDLHLFNPSSPATPGFSSVGLSIQNFQGVYRDDAGVYVSGLYTNFIHGIRYVALNGSVSKMIITNISTFSAGFARDAAGNLYVGDNDDGHVVMFTTQQLAGAISGAPLAMADGLFVHDFGSGGNIGSLAVDRRGRVWAAGWQQNGLKVYDPLRGDETTVIPGLTNANYTVFTFRRNGADFVGYINQANPFSGGTAMRYGYSPAAAAVPFGRPADFDGDQASDLALFWPREGLWYKAGSLAVLSISIQGGPGEIPLGVDFDGDHVADACTYDPPSGWWGGGPSAFWGWSGSVPVPADYDGDGVTDIAVYEPLAGNWYIRQSGGGITVTNWGWAKAVPVPGDYDGDGRADLAVYEPNTGNWYVQYSSGGMLAANWGWRDAQPTAGDYDGDGLADLAVYSAVDTTWYVRLSSGGMLVDGMGGAAAAPVAADYDGDGRTDLAVFERDTGSWTLIRSDNGAPLVRQFGWSETEPVLPQWQINAWMNKQLRLWPVP